ncbi:hypothetical protein [Lysobacter tyrosinilyticus]
MSIWTGLLFLEGAIADTGLARELADTETTAVAPARRTRRRVRNDQEKTMNVFKGLLYLLDADQPASPVLIENRRYGAATAADEFGASLGNRAASERRFGVAAPRERIDLDATADCR